MNINKVAMITGATGSIGRAIARQLADDGFDLALSDIPSNVAAAEELIEELQPSGSACMFVGADVTDRCGMAAAVDSAASRLGRLDVMVNNAGISQVKPFLDLDELDLDAMFRVNVNGVIFGIQAAAAKFRELGIAGTVISAASVSSFRGNPDLAHYSASKFAVRGVTQAAARALAKDSITVNAYAPGIVGSEMWDRIDADLCRGTGRAPGEGLRAAIAGIALGRAATPEDVAGVVSFLASDRAAYMTGQVVIVDGGLISV